MLLSAPALLSGCYVPTMAGDEFTMILAASDFVGWYKCPNGHPYSVGNCTMPMQLARCPACNAPIGGQNHEAVGGVKRLGHTEDLKKERKAAGQQSAARRGYNRDDLMVTSTLDADLMARPGEAATRVLRLFMHLLLHLYGASAGSAHAHERWTTLHKVLRPPDRSLAPGGAGDDAAAQAKLAGGQPERLARAFLEDQLMDDWAGLQQLFGLDEEQLMVALVLVAARLHLASSSPTGFADEAARSSFETVFQERCVRPVLDADVAATVTGVLTALDPTGDVETCRTAVRG